jgi:hypothetical protein
VLSWAEDLKLHPHARPIMTETKTIPAPANPDEGKSPRAADAGESQHQADGRYIPYAGGSLGWYENSGVLAGEARNNYKYFTAMDADMVRAKQYLRAGLRAEKRRSTRRILKEALVVSVKSSKETKQLRVIDISKHGAKIQYSGDDIVLKNSEKVTCQFLEKEGGNLLLELRCTVVRSEKIGKTRTLWNFGLDFPLMTPEQAAQLNEFANVGE